jgi:glycosyltransferase involved in cell wall biosynthesis
MNVLQIRGAFEDSGPGTQTLTISEELRRRGHHVILCSSGGLLADKIISKGFELKIIEELSLEKRNLFNVIKSIYKLRRFLKNNDFDVIHAHNAAALYLAYFATILAGKLNKIKFYHSCRGIELRPNFQWRNYIYKVYPAHLFAVCEYTKKMLVSFGVPERKITVTYNGVDTLRFDINKVADYRTKMREELNIPRDAFVIGIIGRMAVKGHDLLIRAFSKLYLKYTNLYIVLVGVGPDFEKNKKLAIDLGVDDRSIFTGFRTDSEYLNAGFDIFALLSVYGEMFPNAILESMSYKHTFIASNLSGIPEMAVNKEGFIVKIGDIEDIVSKIEILINNEALRLEMGQKAYGSIQNKFNINAVVDKIVDLYNA